MLDGPGDDSDGEDSPGGWRKQEQVDEQYREPAEPEFSDLGPEIPQAPDPTENDIDPELSRRFWALVALFNVALIALSVGAMVALFEGNVELGGQLFVGGLLVLGFGLYRYRTTKARIGESLRETGDSDEAENDDADSADADSDDADSDEPVEQNR